MHDQRIRVTLTKASVTRDLHNDWYMPEGVLFKADMSYTQFAELISTMNVGTGIPVTLRYIKGEGDMPPVKIHSRRTEFIDEFEQKNRESVQYANDLLTKLEKAFSEKQPLKAADRKEILDTVCKLRSEITSNRKFAVEQFHEVTENIIVEAKGEVEAFVQSRLQSLALSALSKEKELKNLCGNEPMLAEEKEEE